MWKELIQLFKKDNLFEQAYQEAAGMLDTDAAMYDASVEALRHSDTAEVKFDIYDADKGVNRSERGVRKKSDDSPCDLRWNQSRLGSEPGECRD